MDPRARDQASEPKTNILFRICYGFGNAFWGINKSRIIQQVVRREKPNHVEIADVVG